MRLAVRCRNITLDPKLHLLAAQVSFDRRPGELRREPSAITAAVTKIRSSSGELGRKLAEVRAFVDAAKPLAACGGAGERATREAARQSACRPGRDHRPGLVQNKGPRQPETAPAEAP